MASAERLPGTRGRPRAWATGAVVCSAFAGLAEVLALALFVLFEDRAALPGPMATAIFGATLMAGPALLACVGLYLYLVWRERAGPEGPGARRAALAMVLGMVGGILGLLETAYAWSLLSTLE